MPPPGAPMPPPGAPMPPPVAYPPVYQQGPAPGIRYSGRAARFVAYLIDGFVISLIAGIPYTFGLTLTVGGGTSEDGGAGAMVIIGVVLLLVALLLGVGYKPWMWSRGGQTVGFKVMHLRVVRAHDGGPLSGGQAIGRLFGYIVSAFVFYLGFIWILFDEKRQGWHDKLANTVVIEV
jgi:uncharacterized RDD family membrane protein YckC